jgi:hypothetical protein
MNELRNAWTPEQVQERNGEANESLPEARTTDRYPRPGRASGVDVQSGEDTAAADEAGTTAAGTDFQVPPDPPQHLNEQQLNDQGGR